MSSNVGVSVSGLAATAYSLFPTMDSFLGARPFTCAEVTDLKIGRQAAAHTLEETPNE